jgi:hypothetical protein
VEAEGDGGNHGEAAVDVAATITKHHLERDGQGQVVAKLTF